MKILPVVPVRHIGHERCFIQPKFNNFKLSQQKYDSVYFCSANNKSFEIQKKQTARKPLAETEAKLSRRFTNEFLKTILPCLTEKNAKTIEYIVDAKNDKGSYKYSSSSIADIFQSINKENADYLPVIMSVEEGRFTLTDVADILSVVNKDNADLLQTVLESKDDNGIYRFDAKDIKHMFPVINPRNSSSLEILLRAKDEIGRPRFIEYDKSAPDSQLHNVNSISGVLEAVTPNNAVFLEPLLDLKNSEGKNRLSGLDISFILRRITPENAHSIFALVNVKDSEGQYIGKSSTRCSVRLLKLISGLQQC